jgi:hypothetical protein
LTIIQIVFRFIRMPVKDIMARYIVAVLTPCVWLPPLASVQEHGGDPVWRQVLLHLLDHEYPEVAQQAAAALAE